MSIAACLQREVAARETHGGEARIRAARFPGRKSLEDFDIDHAPGLRRDQIPHPGTLDFVAGRQNVGRIRVGRETGPRACRCLSAPAALEARDPAPLEHLPLNRLDLVGGEELSEHIEVRDLVDPPKVRSASLSLRPGEVVGLYGLEGHGQDELLACLAGARRPAAGTLLVDGHPQSWPDIAKAARLGFGYVPEDRKVEGLLLDFPGTWNLTLPILRTSIARHGVVSADREWRTAQSTATLAGIRGDIRPPAGTQGLCKVGRGACRGGDTRGVV